MQTIRFIYSNGLMTRQMIIIGGAAILGTSYVFYNTLNNIFIAVKVLTPLSIPFVTSYLTDKAIAYNNPGLLDMVLSLNAFIGKIPYLGAKLEVQINHDKIIESIQNNHFEIADIIISRAAKIDGINLIKVAMAKELKEADLLITKLVDKGVNLNHHELEDQQNIFHDLIKTGRKILIESALGIVKKKPELAETIDKEGNNLAHLTSASPNLRDLVNKLQIKFSSKMLKATNKYAKYPLDILIYSYKLGHAGPQDIKYFIDQGANSNNKDIFKTLLDDKVLTKNGVSLAWIEANNNSINFNLADSSGSLPLDHVIAKIDENLATEGLLDTLALAIAKKTQEAMLQNKHLGYAFITNKPRTAEYIKAKLFVREGGEYSFYRNPLDDNESMLSKMVMNHKLFDKNLFIQAYSAINNYLKYLGTNDYINVLESEQTPLKLSLLQTAAAKKNDQAVEVILDLVEKEMISETQDADEDTICDSHLGLFTSHKCGPIKSLLTNGYSQHLQNHPTIYGLVRNIAIFRSSSLNLMNKALSREDSVALDFPKIKAEQEVSSTFTIKLIDKEGILTKTNSFMQEAYQQNEAKYLEANQKMINTEQENTEKRLECILQAIYKQEEEGIPNQILVKTEAEYKQGFHNIGGIREINAYLGFTMLSFIETKDNIARLLPKNIGETLQGNEAGWAIGYFISSGIFFSLQKDISAPQLLKITTASLAMYVGRKIIVPYLTPNEDKKADLVNKGVIDFISKYGSNIVFDTVLALGQLGITIASGAALGGEAMTKSLLVPLGISLASYYHQYNEMSTPYSLLSQTLPYIGGFYISYLYNKDVGYTTGNPISQKLQIINKIFTTIAVFDVAKHATSLLVDYTIPSFTSYLDNIQELLIGYNHPHDEQ